MAVPLTFSFFFFLFVCLLVYFFRKEKNAHIHTHKKRSNDTITFTDKTESMNEALFTELPLRSFLPLHTPTGRSDSDLFSFFGSDYKCHF